MLCSPNGSLRPCNLSFSLFCCFLSEVSFFFSHAKVGLPLLFLRIQLPFFLPFPMKMPVPTRGLFVIFSGCTAWPCFVFPLRRDPSLVFQGPTFRVCPKLFFFGSPPRIVVSFLFLFDHGCTDRSFYFSFILTRGRPPPINPSLLFGFLTCAFLPFLIYRGSLTWKFEPLFCTQGGFTFGGRCGGSEAFRFVCFCQLVEGSRRFFPPLGSCGAPFDDFPFSFGSFFPHCAEVVFAFFLGLFFCEPATFFFSAYRAASGFKTWKSL